MGTGHDGYQGGSGTCLLIDGGASYSRSNQRWVGSCIGLRLVRRRTDHRGGQERLESVMDG